MLGKHRGGEIVRGGIFWSMSAGEFVTVPADGGQLAGGQKDQYIKTPLPVVLVVGPIMGLLFAMFLPLSGVLVLVPFLAGKVRGAVSPSAAHMATPRVQPGVSYLEPKSHGTAEVEPAAQGEVEGKLIDLAREIAEKREKEIQGKE